MRRSIRTTGMLAGAFSLALSLGPACGDAGNGDDSPTAELIEIGNLGGALTVSFQFGGVDGSYITSKPTITYEPSRKWALVAVALETNPDPEVERSYLVNLDSGEVRRACDEYLTGLYMPSQGLREIGSAYDTNIGQSAYTVAYEVEGDVISVLAEAGIYRCQVAAAANGAPGTFLGLTEYTWVGAAGGADLGSLRLDTIGFEEGHWAGPDLLYRYDGTAERFDWEGYSRITYGRNADATGFWVSALEDSSGEMVIFETSLDGSATELARIPAGGTVSVTDECVQVSELDGACTLVLPDGTVASVSECGGQLTRDGRGYVLGRAWEALDGSARVEHTNSTEAYATPFGTVVNIYYDSVNFKVWTSPVDQPPTPEDPSQQVILAGACEHGCIDTISPTEQGAALFVPYPSGVCAVGSVPNLVFDCDDATTAQRLETEMPNGGAGLWYLTTWGPGSTAMAFESHPVSGQQRFAPGFIREVLPGMESFWLSDERVRALGARSGAHRASYQRVLAVGFDGELYRIDAPY